MTRLVLLVYTITIFASIIRKANIKPNVFLLKKEDKILRMICMNEN